jgi:hypothetical protein
MNVEIVTEKAQFLFLECLFRIFGIVSLQCLIVHPQSEVIKIYNSNFLTEFPFSGGSLVVLDEEPRGEACMAWRVARIS